MVSDCYFSVLGSQQIVTRCLQIPAYRFHPLYRGTWFPTARKAPGKRTPYEFPSAVSRYLVSNFRHTPKWPMDRFRFPSAVSRYLVSNGGCLPAGPSVSIMFPSAVSRYLVSNTIAGKPWNAKAYVFPSAVSRYLVSN